MNPTPHRQLIITKLQRLVGEEQGNRLLDETLAGLGMSTIASAEDRLQVGLALVTRGGAIGMIGDAIATQARLHLGADRGEVARLAGSLPFAAALIDGSNDAIIAQDLDGVIRSWNRGAEELFGHSAQAIIGQNMSAILDADDRVRLTAALEAVKAGESVDLPDVLGVASDGRDVPTAMMLSPVRDDMGHVVAASAIVRDISNDKRALQLEALNTDLQRSNRDLERFAYAASHDLQEPLRVVVAFMELLQDEHAERLDEDAQTYIRYAVEASLRMRRSIDGLLAFARADAGNWPMVTTAIADVVRDARFDLAAAEAEDEARIEVAELPELTTNGPQLKRVFLNLLSNALKFRGPDKPHVAVRAKRHGETWVFEVADNGLGLPEGKEHMAFEPFRRLHVVAKRGSGIGLATVQRIVERLGGKIWAGKSDLGGASFKFTLPIEPPAAARG